MAHYWALWLLVRVGGRVPLPILDGIARASGTLAWWASRRIREVTRDHMRHVLGPTASSRAIDRSARECVRSAVRGYAEFAHLPQLTPAIVRDAITAFDGLDLLLAAREAGAGAIIVSAHLGSPEVISHAAPAFGLRFMALAEPLRPQRVHDFVQGMRAVPGVTYVAANLGGLREARAHLAAGGLLGMIADRDVLGTGRAYAFFGERALMPTGPVELSRRTGAPIFAVWVLREPEAGRYHLVVRPVPLPTATGDRVADVDSGMRALVAELEDGIRRAPGEWFPLVPIWSGLAVDRPGSERPGHAGPYNGGDDDRRDASGS